MQSPYLFPAPLLDENETLKQNTRSERESKRAGGRASKRDRRFSMESSGRSWSIDSYLNEHFDIPAKNPPGEARLRWRRAVGLVVRNRRRRFRMFSGLHAVDDSQRRKILVRTGNGRHRREPYMP